MTWPMSVLVPIIAAGRAAPRIQPGARVPANIHW
jgi:hypothetical protein